VAKTDDPDAVIRETAAIVPVAILPLAHAPFRCEAPFSSDDPRRAAGIIGEYRLCSYHRPNWRRIADASVAARKQTGPSPTSEELLSAMSFDDLSCLRPRMAVLADRRSDRMAARRRLRDQRSAPHLRASRSRCIADHRGHELTRNARSERH